MSMWIKFELDDDDLNRLKRVRDFLDREIHFSRGETTLNRSTEEEIELSATAYAMMRRGLRDWEDDHARVVASAKLKEPE